MSQEIIVKHLQGSITNNSFIYKNTEHYRALFKITPIRISSG
jgi:hypothetical protein